ncbi:cupin domain-containing protein [Dyadobacter sp. NIV53]|uniref:cupin domain-containing protein n=1 Tax=Dyadobacter sp. NIV53 TaxID=2861765 RepID=UPI001C86BB30|nr:cupin domain-containing protein [Dyadobacter sp. NIV53]
MTTTTEIITVDKEDGQSISVAGNNYRIIISGKQTGDSYAVIDMIVPPGGGPGPHAHKNIQEMFYVVKGEVEFKREGGSYQAKEGDFVNIPLGGAVHSFKNKSKENAHLLCTVVPAGLDAFFEEIGKPIEAGTFLPPTVMSQEELDKVKSLAEKYGQQLFPPDFLD